MAEELEEEFTLFRFVPGGPDLEGFFESKKSLLEALEEYDQKWVIAFRKNPKTGLITARVWADGSETSVGPSDFPYPDIWEYFRDCLEGEK